MKQQSKLILVSIIACTTVSCSANWISSVSFEERNNIAFQNPERNQFHWSSYDNLKKIFQSAQESAVASRPIIHVSVNLSGDLKALYTFAKDHPEIAATVTKLSLRMTDLKIVPDEIALFKNLKELSMDRTELPVELSEEVGNIKTLSKLLLLSNAPVMSLPESLRKKVCTPGSKFHLTVRFGTVFFLCPNNAKIVSLVNFTNRPGVVYCNATVFGIHMHNHGKEAFNLGVQLSAAHQSLYKLTSQYIHTKRLLQVAQRAELPKSVQKKMQSFTLTNEDRKSCTRGMLIAENLQKNTQRHWIQIRQGFLT
ncbi:hypothetical protein HOD08_02885 [bacterium]|nr:hypothetical protein [bacterium]